MDFKVTVIFSETLGDCAIHSKAFAAILTCRNGEPLAFDVKDLLLVLPTIERCLSSNTGQNIERNSYFVKVDNLSLIHI